MYINNKAMIISVQLHCILTDQDYMVWSYCLTECKNFALFQSVTP